MTKFKDPLPKHRALLTPQDWIGLEVIDDNFPGEVLKISQASITFTELVGVTFSVCYFSEEGRAVSIVANAIKPFDF